jgi:hypothetical protein
LTVEFPSSQLQAVDRDNNKLKNKETQPPSLPPHQYIPNSLDRHSALLRLLPQLSTLTTPDDQLF